MNIQDDIAAINQMSAVPDILAIVCRVTGMGFAAVARVTDKQWVALEVRDEIQFGMMPGGELKLETTICHEIRQSGTEVVIDHVEKDPLYANHHTPAMYGLQSYISMPIKTLDGEFFGTLCAIDPRPAVLNTPEIIGLFRLYADLIGLLLGAERFPPEDVTKLNERTKAELKDLLTAMSVHTSDEGDDGQQHKALLDKRSPRFIDMIKDSTQRVRRLINNLMTIAAK